MKKAITIIVIILLLAIAIAKCSSCNTEEEEFRMFEGTFLELLQSMEAPISFVKQHYVLDLEFHTRMILSNGEEWNGPLLNTVTNPSSPHFDPSIIDLILVHSEDEAVGFPDNVIVAWPRTDGDNMAQGMINGIHWAISRNERELMQRSPRSMDTRIHAMSLEDFGLSYPLTVADLVDNWEKVNVLWHTLDSSEQNTIMRFAPIGETAWTEDEYRPSEVSAEDVSAPETISDDE